MKKLICLVGPTGSGKTAAALHLARALQRAGLKAVVINADSRQTYRDFPIITAQPSAEEQAVCPHLLYGYLPTTEKSSAGRWADLARQAASDTLAAEGIPLLVGGTGLYLKALLDGMADIPAPDPAVSARLDAECSLKGPHALHARLREVDPAYATRIHPNDRQRVMRALEVWECTGKTFSDWHKATSPGFALDGVLRLGVGLPLPELTPLLGGRINAMLNAGALDEARAALQSCPDTSAPGWTGIGCAEVAAHLAQFGAGFGAEVEAETLSLEDCVSLWTRNTRAYAKRQWTWFRADSRILWHRPGEEAVLERLVMDFLA